RSALFSTSRPFEHRSAADTYFLSETCNLASLSVRGPMWRISRYVAWTTFRKKHQARCCGSTIATLNLRGSSLGTRTSEPSPAVPSFRLPWRRNYLLPTSQRCRPGCPQGLPYTRALCLFGRGHPDSQSRRDRRVSHDQTQLQYPSRPPAGWRGPPSPP